jgi:hypothetical protein
LLLKIAPQPTVRTYMVGSSVWELTSRMESAAGKVVIGPPDLTDGGGRKGLAVRRTNQALTGVALLVIAILATPLLMTATGLPYWVGMNRGMMAGYSMPWTSGMGRLFGMVFGGAMMLIPWVLAIIAAVLIVNAFTSSSSWANRRAEHPDPGDRDSSSDQ